DDDIRGFADLDPAMRGDAQLFQATADMADDRHADLVDQPVIDLLLLEALIATQPVIWSLGLDVEDDNVEFLAVCRQRPQKIDDVIGALGAVDHRENAIGSARGLVCGRLYARGGG